MARISRAAGAALAVAIGASVWGAGQSALAQSSSDMLAQCVVETAAAPRLACFERVAFAEAAARFAPVDKVYGGCMARIREAERLGCFEAMAPPIAPPPAAPPVATAVMSQPFAQPPVQPAPMPPPAPLPTVTMRPPSEPQTALPPAAAPPPAAPPPAAAPVFAPAPMASSGAAPRTAPSSPGLASASPPAAPRTAPPSPGAGPPRRTAPPPPSEGQVEMSPAPVMVADAPASDSGWMGQLGRDSGAAGPYLRGQLGYAFGLDANIKDNPPSGPIIACLARGTSCGGELNDIGDSVSFGVGAGYRWNRQFRFDLTLDYRPGFAVDDSDQATPFAANYKGDISSLVVLANAYWDLPVDFGQWSSMLRGVRPWIGFGLGFAHNEVDDLTYTQSLATGATATGRLPGNTATSFAWQAGLGLGIEISPQLTLDVGYRYLDAGEIKTKAGTVNDSVFGALPVGEAKGDLTSHELMVGLRYKL